MTALHVLCCNPFATLDLIETLLEAWPGAVSVKNVNGMMPYMMFLTCRNLSIMKMTSNSAASDANSTSANTNTNVTKIDNDDYDDNNNINDDESGSSSNNGQEK
mmetsp:Transcript_19042/g.28534  ORF Transcript_19042/g.28534 Transcript_19042/m.28534 type:complete len:104 (+) Transcript_19042:625-936(+)